MAQKCGIKIEVTRDHIKRGDAGDPQSCAIALALSESFGGDVPVKVDDQIQIGEMIFNSDTKIQKFIENFDSKDLIESEYVEEEEKKKAKVQFKKARPFTLYLTNGKAYAG